MRGLCTTHVIGIVNRNFQENPLKLKSEKREGLFEQKEKIKEGGFTPVIYFSATYI